MYMGGIANWVDTKFKDGAHHDGVKVWDVRFTSAPSQ